MWLSDTMQIERSGLIYERVRATKFEKGYIVVFGVCCCVFSLISRTASFACVS